MPTRRLTWQHVAQGGLALTLAGVVIAITDVGGQGPAADPKQRAEEWKVRSRNFEQTGLAEPFKGITTDGAVVPHLSPVRSARVATAPVVAAAQSLLPASSEPRRTKTTSAADDTEWGEWMNQPFYVRQAVGFAEMAEKQREAAFG